jgi:hypothetical protein
MGDTTAVQLFSLTPDEERFFIRFTRRHALPLAAAVSALAGGLSATLLSCSLVAQAPAVASSEAVEPLEAPGLAPPLADEQARAGVAELRAELAALRDQPARADALAPPAPTERFDDLQRSVDGLKRELQTLATALTELQRRSGGEALPAAADAAPPQLDPLRKRVTNIEARQDREEAARLEWAGNVEQRVRNLEAARGREVSDPVALQRLMDRVHALEEAVRTRP